MASNIVRPDYSTGENRLGIVAYGIDDEGDWVFQGPRLKMDFQLDPVYDESGRVVIYHKGTIALRAMVTVDQSDMGGTFTPTANIGFDGPPRSSVTSYTNMRSAHAGANHRLMGVLSRSGGRLLISGFGPNIDINTDACTFNSAWGIDAVGHDGLKLFRDVNFGPKPVKLTVTSYGPVLCEVLWVVSFHIVQCGELGEEPTDVVRTDYFRELNFGVDYSIDSKGLTKQTVSGYYTSYVFRDNDDRKNIIGTADQMVDFIKPEVPLGFRRVSWNRRLSYDKMRMDFSIVDEQINSKDPWPGGVTDIRVTQTVRIASAIGNTLGMTVTMNFGGHIEVSLQHDLSEAWSILILVLQDRVDAFRQSFKSPKGGKSQGFVYITSVTLSEEIFGPKRITFGIEMFGQVGLTDNQFNKDLIKKAGLFRPVDNIQGLSWEAFRDSHKDLTWSPRGLAGLEFREDNDVIVSACDGTTPADVSNALGRINVNDDGGSLTNECPPKEASYLLWTNDVTIINGVQRQQFTSMLPENHTIERETVVKDQKGTEIAGEHLTITEQFEQTYSIRDTMSNVKLVIKGRALRAGRYSKVPDIHRLLKDNEGVDNIKRGTDISSNKSRVKGVIGNCRIYETKWDFTCTFSGLAAGLLETIKEITALGMSASDDPDGKAKAGDVEAEDDGGPL